MVIPLSGTTRSPLTPVVNSVRNEIALLQTVLAVALPRFVRPACQIALLGRRVTHPHTKANIYINKWNRSQVYFAILWGNDVWVLRGGLYRRGLQRLGGSIDKLAHNLLLAFVNAKTSGVRVATATKVAGNICCNGAIGA